MKVLFNIHPAAFQTRVFGGAEIQFLKTLEYVQKGGVKAKKFDMFSDKVEDFDILHNFEMNRDTYNLFMVAKGENVKIALSPVYWKHTNMLFSEEGIKSMGKVVYEKLGMLKSSLNPFFRLYPYRSFLENADIILPNSEMEADMISKRFNILRNKFIAVPNGVDRKFANAKPELFARKYKIKDFVLFVGRIEPRKNLLKFVKAVKKLKLPAVIIGHASPSMTGYLKECQKEAKGANIRFIGSMPHDSEMLKSAYAAAKVLALPSWFETPGLVALEGGLAGCSLAITNGGSTTEYFKNMADYCDPKSQESINEAIENAYNRDKSEKLKHHILKNFTWEHVAKKTIEAYRRIL